MLVKTYHYYLLLALVKSSQVYADSLYDIPAASGQSQSNNQLFLMTSINQGGLNDLVACRLNAAGDIEVKNKDLKKLRIILPNYQDEQWVDLRGVKNLTYRYDAPNQNLFINTASGNLSSYNLSANSQGVDTAGELSPAINAMVINYTAFNSTTNTNGMVSGGLNLLYTTGLGSLYSNSLYNFSYKGSNDNKPIVRLDSGWQYIDNEKVRSYLFGDYVSNTTEWSNSLRLTGIQISSAYSKRPDVITAALPQFSGSAALPSSLDLYVDQQKVYSTNVPSGPFDIKSLPYVNGSDVSLVTTDTNGRQVRTEAKYYFSPNILQRGLSEYSLDIGIPRYDFGRASNHYDNDVVFSAGSLRYGLTDRLTASTHIENSSDGLNNAGLGIAKSFWGMGVINADIAGSQYKNSMGGLTLVGIESRLSPKLTANASYQRTYQDYYDLARVSQKRYQASTTMESNINTVSPYASTIARGGLNYRLFSQLNISTNYNSIVYRNDTYRTVSLNLSGNITSTNSFYLTLNKNLRDSHDVSAFLTYQYQPRNDINLTSNYSNNAGTSSLRQQFDKLSTSSQNSLNYGGYYQTAKQEDSFGGYASVNTRYNSLTLDFARAAQNYQANGSATGSVVLAENSLFFAQRIDNAFTIIKNAGPGSHIINGGVDLGATNSQGALLVSGITPYVKNNFYIDPTHLPLDWQPVSTSKSVTTSYNQGTLVDFKVRKVMSALVKIVDGQHQPIAPGYQVQLNQESPTVVGYDSEVYLTGIQSHNKVSIDLLDKGHCEFTFDYSDNTSPTHPLGPYLCH